MDKRRYMDGLYRELYPVLLRWAERSVPGQGEDFVQEAFCIAWTKRMELFESANPAGWVVKTLKNILRNHRRQQGRRVRLVGGEAVEWVEDPWDAYSELVLRSDCCAVLSPEERRLFDRALLQGESCPAIAVDLGIPLGACQKRLQRLTAKLRTAL